MSKKIYGFSKRNWKCFFVGFVLAWLCAGGCCAAFAGVPVKFTVETSRADVQEVQCYHGETLDFDVTFKNYGKDLVFDPSMEAQIFWQTNGMSAFYWRTNNVNVVSNRMTATFLPEMDPGANTVFGFIGIPGDIYRASFVLRLKQSPGWKVREMEWPYRDLDFSKVQVLNAPYFTKDEANDRIDEEIREATNKLHQAVSAETDAKLVVLDDELRAWAEGKFRTIADSYTKAEIDAFIATLATKAGLIAATNRMDLDIRAWAESEFQKSWELEEVQLGKDAHATGTKTTAIGAYSEASGISSVAFGNGAEAKGTYPIAIGLYAKGTNGNSVAVGSYADAVNGGVAIGPGGQWTPTRARGAGIAIGTGADADQYGVALGYNAKAGQQSLAVGREAKALQVGSIAIGPNAQTTAANQMRLMYGADEIMIGISYPESLREVIQRLAPAPDITRAEVKTMIADADFMPTKWYTVRGGVTQEVVEIRAIVSGTGESKRTVLMYFEPQTNDDVLSMQMKDRTLVTFQSGSGVSVKDGARITLGKPDRLWVDGSTNLAQYVEAAKPADYATVRTKALAAAPQATTYSKTETDALIAENKPEYEDIPSNVVWRIEAEGGRFFFKPIRPINMEN